MLFLLLLAACSKDDVEGEGCNEPTALKHLPRSTVAPSKYLPAYPGSWWTYSDGSQISTGPAYEMRAVLSTNWDPNHGIDRCCPIAILRLPIYDGLPLYGYTLMRQDAPDTHGSCCERLLSETLGDVYYWGGTHYGRTKLRTMAIDTTITLTSGTSYMHCIMVKGVGGIYANYFNNTGTYKLTFYAPDIGLVKEVYIAGQDTTVRELTDHWIAEH